MSTVAGLAVAVALAFDLAVGELPTRVHPVAWFGRLVGRLDRAWAHPRAVGVVGALCCPLAAAAVVGVLVHLASRYDPWAATVVAALALFVATSYRRLLTAGATVVEASVTDGEEAECVRETDLDRAREAARALVGRHVETLSPAQLRSAAVESLAENLSDGFVAPLFAFAIGSLVSLPLAAAAAVWVKGVNTMDSMLGYRDVPVGWGPARLDDVVMWLPARLTAGLLAVAARAPTAPWRARSEASRPASPNAGWPMATLSTALDVRLEKPGHYVFSGDATLPDAADGRRALRTVAVAGGLAAGAAGVVAWL